MTTTMIITAAKLYEVYTSDIKLHIFLDPFSNSALLKRHNRYMKKSTRDEEERD